MADVYVSAIWSSPMAGVAMVRSEYTATLLD
jgi:hypothetical protein